MKLFMPVVKLLMLFSVVIPVAEVMALNPQPEPPEFQKGLNASKFKTLPDNAVIGGFTKRQILQQLENLKSEAVKKSVANAKQFNGNIDKLGFDYDQKFKTKLQDGNQRLVSLIGSFSKPVDIKSAGNKLGRLPTKTSKPLPVIAEVIPASVDGKPAARPGGWVAIKGENLEEFCEYKPGYKPGKILLKGGFPGGHVVLAPNNIYPCSGKAIIANIPNITKVMDQQVKLVLQTSDNHTVASGSMIEFIAKRKVTAVNDSIIVVKECSTNATLDNICELSYNGRIPKSTHINLPISQATTGTDTFKYNFSNGWKLYKVDRYMGVGFDCAKVDDTTSTLTWTSPELKNLQYLQSHECLPLAEGPEGVPMK